VIGLALVLLTLALADLAAGGVGGTPDGRLHPWLRRLCVLCLSLAAAAVYLWVTGSATAAGALLLLALAGALAWLEPRAAAPDGRSGPALLALAVTVLAAALVLPAVFTESVPPELQQSFQRQPWALLQSAGPPKVLLLAALLAFLGATGNGVVRLGLGLIRGSEAFSGEEQLKGGRFIGPLERYLIFGLALAGQPTAAALVISAKSIIRFPELQGRSGAPAAADAEARMQRVDVLTEYFLLGSLLSWILALVAVLPLAGT
jgi:hypothetical protein